MPDIAVFFSCALAHADVSKPTWNISGLTLSPLNDQVHRLSFRASQEAHFSYAMSTEVVLTTVDSSFVWGNKLAVLGDAGRSQALVIFDLKNRKEIDWLFCYEPQRIGATWVAYVEFYPAHSTGNPRDVVLVYDLARSPRDNRLEVSSPLRLPPHRRDYPVHVGIPVYPDSNAQEKTYINEVVSEGNSGQILGPPFFLLLSSKRLVFLCSIGSDYDDYVTYLIAVDLSKGLRNAYSKTVPIPFAQLPKRTGNPNFLPALKLQEAGAMAVRILLSKPDYGTISIVVKIPPSPA